MKVQIYSSEHCFWCQKAKQFFKENNIAFEEIDVNDPWNKDRVLEAVKATGQSSIPIINIDGEWIVGFNEDRIKELISSPQGR